MKSLPLKISILILILLPGSFSKIVPDAESLKEGLLAASALASIILMICGQKINKNNARRMSMRFAFLIFALLLHAALTIFSTNFNISRFTLSLTFLTLIILLWIPIIESIYKAESSALDSALSLCYWVLLADGLSSTALYILTSNKTMFFASEPSHFALTFLPFLSYMLFKDRSPLHFVGALLISIFINNLTLLIGIALLATFHYRHRLILLITIVSLGFLAAITSPSYSDYVLDRLTLSSDTENLTALVFMSGYERAYATLAQGHLLGVGFQQMGFAGPSGEFIDVIARVTNGYQANLYDGGTLASKLVVEFGLLGLAALALYLAGLKNLFFHGIQPNAAPCARFFASVYISFFCYIFIRGTGYISTSVLLFIFAIFSESSADGLSMNSKILDLKFSRFRIA